MARIISETVTGSTASASITAAYPEYVYTAQGTFNSQNANLEFSLDAGSTWTACGTDTSLSANGGGVAVVPHGALLRVKPSGVTSVVVKVTPTNYGTEGGGTPA